MFALRGRLVSLITTRVAVRRNIALSALLRNSDGGDANKKFEQAKEKLDTLTEDPGNEKKLEIYSLFKQATEGKNTTDKPAMFNFVAQAKWNAWDGLGDMSQDDAKKAYADLVDELASQEGK